MVQAADCPVWAPAPRAYMRRISSALLLAGPLLLALLVGGCPKTTATPDAGPVTNTGQCSVDAECKVGFKCDRELLRCVCTSDDACPATLLCNAFTGQCVTADEIPGCTTDGDCKASQYCDTPTRTCHARKAFCEPCDQDGACGTASDRCVLDPTLNQKFCGQACQDDTGCPEGTTCQTVSGARTCWPAVATCEQLKGCNPNSGQGCAADADCTEGEDQVCDQVQGTCVARVPTCPFGMVCNRDNHQCEAACTTDDECNADPDCQTGPCRCTNNECVRILRCSQDTDCESGKVCVVEAGQSTGECGTACDSDADCPQGTVCQNRGARNTCAAGCITDADCPLTENCEAGHCVTGCQLDDVCDACQRCLPVTGTYHSDCTDVGPAYCWTTCTGPAGAGCAKSGANFCCRDSATSPAYIRVDCTSVPCPSGFECVTFVDLMDNPVGRACIPLGTTCQEPGCN